MSAIETEGLTKEFGTRRALDSLDLRVARGEVFGWLGPNGAGKTTTVRLLLDFIRPTAGHAMVLGAPSGDPEVRRRIGYLPAELKLDPSYTGDEVFSFFGALRGGFDHTTVSELTDRFDLDPSRRIGDLSTGNRRKVGIVQAFAHRPELLILDEPTSGLDPLLQREFYDLVREVSAEQGATVFLSSHVLPEVEALASRVGILRAGQLVALADVEHLRHTARQRMTFLVREPPDHSILADLPEVVECTIDGTRVDVTIEGSAERAIRALSASGVMRVTSHDDDLEDVFLRFYGELS